MVCFLSLWHLPLCSLNQVVHFEAPVLVQNNVQVRTQYDTESQRCVSLSVQLEDMRARVTRAEALAAKVGPLQDQLAALQASLSKLQYEASLASGRAATNIDKLVRYRLPIQGTAHIHSHAMQLTVPCRSCCSVGHVSC